MARLSRRQRQTLGSLVVTVIGCGMLFIGAMQVDAARDTDLVDPTRNVRSEFVTGGGEATATIRLRDVARDVGLDVQHAPWPRGRNLPEDTGSGLAWGDYDGDGDFDLYIVSYPPRGSNPEGACELGANRLFRNEGGRFVDVTAEAGVGDPTGFGMGATFADFDGDGRLDLYVTNRGPNRLFRNLGGGAFEEVAEARGVADPAWSTGVAWGDYDRDGHLDLYVCNYVTYAPTAAERARAEAGGGAQDALPITLNPNAFDPEPNRLYHNRGDGTFEDVAVAAGVDDPNGRSLAATFCDLDGDGWLDLYVNNDVSKNRMYLNLGERRTVDGACFNDVSTLTGTADPRGSMGLSVAEVGDMLGQGDGLPDLFITHWVAQENALYQSLRTPNGRVEYRDRTRALRLGEISLDSVGWGSVFVDLDLDADVDLAVANGSTLQQRDDPMQLVPQFFFVFANEGQSFREVAAATGAALATPHNARGLAAADFDADGDVDLAVSINRGRLMLLANESEGPRRSLTVRLAGPAIAAFGARIELLAAGVRQHRWYGADVSFLSMHATDAVFGLGEATVAEELSVHWADGAESALQRLPAGLTIVTHPTRSLATERSGALSDPNH